MTDTHITPDPHTPTKRQCMSFLDDVGDIVLANKWQGICFSHTDAVATQVGVAFDTNRWCHRAGTG